MLANAGVRNLPESRAAGETSVLKYVIPNIAQLWVLHSFGYYMRCHCPQAGRDITASCTDFSCSKGSGMRETKLDQSYTSGLWILSQRTGKWPKVAPVDCLAPYMNNITPPSRRLSTVSPWQWGLTWMHKGTQGASATQLSCFRFEQQLLLLMPVLRGPSLRGTAQTFICCFVPYLLKFSS